MKTPFFTAYILILFPLLGFSQNTDRRAVLQTAQDYVDAMYEADAGKMDNCLHENFIKNGYYWKAGEESFSNMTLITRPQMIQIAKDWNKEDWVPDDAPKDINLLDIQEKIAVVKVTAYWGIDYLHISRNHAQWRIAQILSQNWPRKDISD